MTRKAAPQTTPDGTEVYRVRDKRTGHHITVALGAYDADVHAILDRPAVDADGRPLPPKYAADLNERPGDTEAGLLEPADTQADDQGEPIEDANAAE